MDGGDRLEVSVLGGIDEIAAAAWDACADAGGPTVRATRSPRTGSCWRSRPRARSGRGAGWAPRHSGRAAGRRGDRGHAALRQVAQPGRIHLRPQLGDAFERAGGRYYPKLQAAVPFTPATGRRFLTRPGLRGDRAARRWSQAATDWRRRTGCRRCTSPSAPAEERAWGEAAGPHAAAARSSSTG